MNGKMVKGSFVVAMALAAALLAMACAPAAAPSPTPTTAPAATTASAPKAAAPTTAPAPTTAAPKSLVKLKFGFVPAIPLATLGAAVEKGWFKEAGIDLETVSFARGTELLQALVGGQIDLGYVGAQSAAFNAIAKGADFRFITTMGQVIGQEQQWQGAMMIRTDLWNSGLRTLKDLKGKTIKISVKGGITYYQFQKLAEKEGLSVDDFKISTISNVEAVDALRGKSIEGGVMNEPEATRIVQEKLAVIHSYDKDLFPKGEVVEALFVLASGNVLKNNPEAVKAFLEAYKKGIGYYMDAQETGKNVEEVAGYIEKYAKVPKDIALESRKAGGWLFVPRDGVSSASSLMKWQQSFKEIETLDTIVPQDSLFAKGVSLYK